MSYDSEKDTLDHIGLVRSLLGDIIIELMKRVENHDASKLSSPEKEGFDKYTPILRDLTYGSDEYKKSLADMQPFLKHHYEANRHHPEHFKNGINDMNLLDLVEMLCDWAAATRRHADGSIRDSLAINKGRFNISPQLYRVICNTAVDLGWIPSLPAGIDEPDF